MLIFSSDAEEISNLIQNLNATFEIKDIGGVKKTLGINVRYGKNYIFLTQQKYIHKLLNQFNMINNKGVTLPLPCHTKLSQKDGLIDEDEKQKMMSILYEKL